MPFEIDMLNVGNADAIILRYIDEKELEYVILIDAGKTKAHGIQVVNHINKYTNKKHIDLAISTHPDKDHIGGFEYVVNNVDIKEFWIHDPKSHVEIDDKIIKSFNELEALDISKGLKHVCESLSLSKDLISLIDEKDIRRYEPLEGREHLTIPIKILGPTKDYYEEKLAAFRDFDKLFESLVALEKAEILEENWIDELSRFDKKADKSNENNSSAIALFAADNRKVLFTSDAGPEALQKVIDKYNLEDLHFLDVPHHGSQYNINTDIMDVFKPKTAYISCIGDYPSETIVKYLKGKGTKVYSTKVHGQLRYSVKIPSRPGWSTATPM